MLNLHDCVNYCIDNMTIRYLFQQRFYLFNSNHGKSSILVKLILK